MPTDFRTPRRRTAVFALWGALLLNGCAAHPSLIGKWSGTMPIGGQSISQELDFKSDGTLIQTVEGGKIVANGTYTTKDDTLTMVPVSATLNGMTIPLPAQAKAPQVKKYAISGDTLTLKTGSVDLTLTREK